MYHLAYTRTQVIQDDRIPGTELKSSPGFHVVHEFDSGWIAVYRLHDCDRSSCASRRREHRRPSEHGRKQQASHLSSSSGNQNYRGDSERSRTRMPVIRESKRDRSTLRSEFHQSADDRRSTEFCMRSHSEYREAAGPPGAVDPSRREGSAIRGKIQECAMRELSGIDRNRKIPALLVETFNSEVADAVQFENRIGAVDREFRGRSHAYRERSNSPSRWAPRSFAATFGPLRSPLWRARSCLTRCRSARRRLLPPRLHVSPRAYKNSSNPRRSNPRDRVEEFSRSPSSP